MTAYQVGFIMEQALGHITHAKNLHANLQLFPDVQAEWGFIPFEVSGIAAHLPAFKSNWTIRAGLRARAQLASMARRTRLDALFFHTQVPAVLATDWVRRIPSIISLDATPLQYDALGGAYGHTSGPRALENLKWKLNRDCLHAAHRLVTWSVWAKQGLIEDYAVPAERVTVIPPGVNIKEWRRPGHRRASDAPARILFVGGDLERKGGASLLRVFRALRPLGATLHMVTRAPVAPEPGVFVYNNLHPNSAELKQLYHSCDIFCLPTAGDCLPMVLSEAGAAGLPAVSTRLAGIPEIVNDGETGLLVPVGDEPALADALRQLILDQSLRLRLGERATEHVAREYDAQRNAARLLDLIRSAIETARTHYEVRAWRKSC
jgi:glycosyltransferase involved in cell wall biosynthesis